VRDRYRLKKVKKVKKHQFLLFRKKKYNKPI